MNINLELFMCTNFAHYCRLPVIHLKCKYNWTEHTAMSKNKSPVLSTNTSAEY